MTGAWAERMRRLTRVLARVFGRVSGRGFVFRPAGAAHVEIPAKLRPARDALRALDDQSTERALGILERAAETALDGNLGSCTIVATADRAPVLEAACRPAVADHPAGAPAPGSVSAVLVWCLDRMPGPVRAAARARTLAERWLTRR